MAADRSRGVGGSTQLQRKKLKAIFTELLQRAREVASMVEQIGCARLAGNSPPSSNGSHVRRTDSGQLACSRPVSHPAGNRSAICLSNQNGQAGIIELFRVGIEVKLGIANLLKFDFCASCTFSRLYLSSILHPGSATP